MPDDPSPSGSGSDGSPGPSPGPAAASEPPAVLTRQELLQQRRTQGSKGKGGTGQGGQGHGQRRTWWYALGALAAVVVAVAVAAVLTRGDRANAAKPVVVTTTRPAGPVATCPLTGTPAPGGVVPARPALGVKIGNYTGDRPSAGLNQADIVFEEPVEGAITRLVAVFQCHGASLVGDLRSAREPDVGILSQLSDPLFVHAGGIDPVIALLASSPLIDENLYSGNNGSAIIYEPGRVAPYSTFVNTASLWAFDPSDKTPPAPIFHYTPSLPAGSVAGSGASVHIPYSSTSDVTWTWNAASGKYLRSYAGQPDKLLDGTQTAATNVVVLSVVAYTGAWVENSEGGMEVDVTPTGIGPLVVLRNGVAITGTWNRPSLTQPAVLTSTSGAPITLAPGSTWEELVPDAIPVTTTGSQKPAAVAPPTTAVPPAG